MDNTERNKGFSAIVRKFPVGAISMVSPFNFPCAPLCNAWDCPFTMHEKGLADNLTDSSATNAYRDLLASGSSEAQFDSCALMLAQAQPDGTQDRARHRSRVRVHLVICKHADKGWRSKPWLLPRVIRRSHFAHGSPFATCDRSMVYYRLW